MWHFIVLGYIPGTNIRFDFDLLATVVLVCGFGYMLWLMAQDEQKIREDIVKSINEKTL